MNSIALDNFKLVKDAVYIHGTMSPSELQQIIKAEHDKVLNRNTIHRHLQAMKDSNLTWISDQAKAAYLQSVRKIIYSKKKRLMELEQERTDCTQPRTKAYYAQVINETEEGLRVWMEGLPLLMQFSKVMNHDKQEDSVIISD